MSRHAIAATLAALALASILTPASARSFGSVRAISISNASIENRPHHHGLPNYTNGFVSPFGLGTGGLNSGGQGGGCPPSICGHPHPQVR